MTRRATKGEAPALRWIFAKPLSPPVYRDGTATYARAAKELRALLSVASAALRVSNDSVGDPLAVEHLCALDRALARLARASRGET